jgi:hypothetical protein
MYNPSIIWYKKIDVLNIYPITERTYFRKIKEINNSIKTKILKNPQGKPSTLIYYQDLNKVFGKYRKPNNLDNLQTKRKYIGTSDWDIIGNIVPLNGTIKTIKESMLFIKRFIESKMETKTKDWFFYSIEKNPKDDFYHSHFLIKTKLQVSQLEKVFELICEIELGGKNRMWIRKYDYSHYHYSGSFYSFKTSIDDKGEGSVFHQMF